MSDKVVFIPTRTLSNNDSLLLALFIAAIIHLLVVLGTNFTVPKAEKVNKSIDITLVNMPAPKAPKKANFLAQDNQLGAGNQAKKAEPPAQKMPSQGSAEKKPLKKTEPKEVKPQSKAPVWRALSTTLKSFSLQFF